MKVFSDVIESEGTGISKSDQKKLERIKDRISSMDGVSSVNINSMDSTIEVGYSGPYEDIEEIERGVASGGNKCALVSPAVVKFRAGTRPSDEGAIISAFKGQNGVREVILDGSSILIFADICSVDLDGLESAARSAGISGRIVSHEVIKLRLRGEDGDLDALLEKLNDTKFVLKACKDGEEVCVTIVRGRISKRLVHKIASSCGFKT